MENITAEEFFRAKIKELNPIQMVVTLANETISGEQGLRWAHEFKELHTTTLQAELEKAKELLREARDWMKEEASIKMRNGANRDVVDSYDDKAYKLTTFLEAKCGSDCPCTNIKIKKSGRCRN